MVYVMVYGFICPKCGKTKEIIMSASNYKSEGHFCDCGEELKRDPSSFCCSFKTDCEGFFGKTKNK